MYYTTFQLQYRPQEKISIKCFGCGGPHKKVDFPNCMIHAAFLPFCGDCGLGHPISECSLIIQVQVPQIPTTPFNMIGSIANSYEKSIHFSF